MRNSHALRRMPSTSTSTSKKSTSARSPGRYVSGTKTSRRCRFHSATASLTTVTPTRWPSASNNACSRVAVSRCLPPVHRTESASTACTRSAIASQTGRGRGVTSAFRTGAASSTYFPTVVRERPSSRATARCVRPSTSTLCRTTCTRSILSILSANPRSRDPASPPSGPQVAYFPSGVWPTF
jgi:hypothetical protein